MNREDIIAMAQEAIILHGNDNPFDFQLKTVAQLECFAALVAAAEREECAKLAEAMQLEHPSGSAVYSGDVAAAIRRREAAD